MSKILSSRKFWYFILVLLIAGLFFFYSLSQKKESPTKEIEKINQTSAEIGKSVSSVYRYDFQEQNYVGDSGNSWQNSDFSRFIYDVAPEGTNLDKCYYFLYDNIEKEMTGGGERKCNNNLTITVGENKNCLSQGENSCTLYVYAVDKKGNQGEMASVTYNIDWEAPKIGKPEQQNGTFLAEISDNLEVNYCWFYLDGENLGSMKIENNLASFDYQIKEDESHSAFVRCADHYDAEKNGYLNLASSELLEIAVSKNQPPVISFCKLSPTQGNKETNFSFQVEASNPEGGNLTYNWDFGDGKTSDEKNPNHYYSSLGTFEPKVSVSDTQGEKADCSTAWAVVSE